MKLRLIWFVLLFYTIFVQCWIIIVPEIDFHTVGNIYIPGMRSVACGCSHSKWFSRNITNH